MMPQIDSGAPDEGEKESGRNHQAFGNPSGKEQDQERKTGMHGGNRPVDPGALRVDVLKVGGADPEVEVLETRGVAQNIPTSRAEIELFHVPGGGDRQGDVGDKGKQVDDQEGPGKADCQVTILKPGVKKEGDRDHHMKGIGDRRDNIEERVLVRLKEFVGNNPLPLPEESEQSLFQLIGPGHMDRAGPAFWDVTEQVVKDAKIGKWQDVLDEFPHPRKFHGILTFNRSGRIWNSQGSDPSSSPSISRKTGASASNVTFRPRKILTWGSRCACLR